MLAIAQMYIQGVSTRRATKVLEGLCGTEVTSMQVSRATQALDAEFGQWRDRENDVLIAASVEVPGLDIDRRLRAVWLKGAELPPVARDLLDQLPGPL